MAETTDTTKTDAAAAEAAAAATAAAETAATETAAAETAAAEAAAAETAATETADDTASKLAEVQAELETLRAQLADVQGKLTATETERDAERSGRVNDRKAAALTEAATARGAFDLDDVLGAVKLDEVEEGKEADAIAALAERKAHWFKPAEDATTAVAAPVAGADAITDAPDGETPVERAGAKLLSLVTRR